MCKQIIDTILCHKYIEITSVLRDGHFALESVAPFTGNMKKSIDITFSNSVDFRRRIVGLWQRQEEDEEYNFIFLCTEAENEFEKLFSSFQRYDRE